MNLYHADKMQYAEASWWTTLRSLGLGYLFQKVAQVPVEADDHVILRDISKAYDSKGSYSQWLTK